MIKLNAIEKTYRNKSVSFHALRGISLEICAGEFVAIMGRSGCGKTTLMNIMGFMDHFDAGQYIFDGKDVSTFNDAEICSLRNQSIGFVFQSFNLVSDYTLLENVEMPMGYAGISAKLRRERATAMLESVGLGDKLKNRPAQLSGGQQQRATIARALVNEPRVILADEPTGNLDSRSGEDVMELLSGLREKNITLVLVTHDEKIAKHADRTIHLSDGLVVADT